MARPRSFVVGSLSIDHAKRAHNCQHSSKHRIVRGEPRLKVKVGRTVEHYCLACAIGFVDRDIETLRDLRSGMQEARAKFENTG